MKHLDPITGHQFDAEDIVVGHRQRLLVRPEIAVAHGGDVGLRVGRPGPHRVGMVTGVVLDRLGRPAIGVALAQHRVHGAALHLVVGGLDGLLLVVRRLVRVVRDGVAGRLQLGDRGLQLRNRGADVGQLDDVGFRRLRQLPELGQIVGHPLLGRQTVRDRSQDATGQRDVTGLHRNPRRSGVGPDYRQERAGGQRRCLVGVGVENGR